MSVDAILPRPGPSAMPVRLQLANARIRLRRAQDEYDVVIAYAEQRITEAAGGPRGLGANADERSRVLKLALDHDEEYQAALASLRDAQADVDRFAAVVEILLDERKAADRDSRDRLTAALQQLGVADDEHPADGLAVHLTSRRAT